ncbi:MAG: DUF72 domain-containing protein [Anaerolineae bacterium]|nr:DUF72 domain-containing protein [Anaerolineae bacterium]
MADWYLGTVGFSYKDWDGVFYPPGAPARQYLAHYSQIFNSVELDSTFYGTPPPDRVRQWAMTVPPGFKFCVKTPRQITHDMRLFDALGPMTNFLETMSLLGDALGPILIQLPPSLTDSEIDTVNTFIAGLPSAWRYAIEFRHPSWFTPQTAELLAAHHLCWVSTEYENVPKQVVPTTDFLYIRWLGKHGQFERKNKERIDVTPQLQWWIDQLEPHFDRFETIYGFFNNDYSGHSPRTCNRFKEMMGLEAIYPEIPQQGRLF